MKMFMFCQSASKLAARALLALAAACSLNLAVAAERTVLGNPQPTPLISSGIAGVQEIYSDLRAKALNSGSARVIVGVRAAFAPEGVLSPEQQAQQRNDIATAQQVVLSQLSQLDTKSNKPKKFETIPFMALVVSATELDELVRLKEVTSIEEDKEGTTQLQESTPLIGMSSGSFSGFTGAGQTVAILDTGVDKNHPDLTGRVVAEACYSTTSSSATSLCPGGTNSTATGSALPYANGVCGAGKCDHGTHVAATAAGAVGVARGANIIAVQVFSWLPSQNKTTAYWSDLILGLERVYALRTTHSISAVNMSLGGVSYSDQTLCDSQNASVKTAIDNLRSAGIASVIASGNDGYTNKIGTPGCISSAISVGATWDQSFPGQGWSWSSCSQSNPLVDTVACFSNSVSFLSLLAPGVWINAAVPGNSYGNYSGTSMATPHVAGAWAVLKSKSTSATVDQVLSALTSTGTSVTDTRNSVTKPRINIGAAVNGIGGGSTFALTVSKAGTGTGSVLSAPGGISCGSSCSANFSSGTTVTLTATADSNSVFAGWSGSGCSGLGTCTVTMSTARSVSATFSLKSAPVTPLTLTGLAGIAGSEQHFQVQVPAGATDLLVSTSGGTGDADLYVKYGAAASLSVYDCRSVSFTNTETCSFASPSVGTYYIMLRGFGAGPGFSGVTLTVTYRASGTAYTLSVSKAGTGSGTVTSSPAGVSCGVDCQEPFASGSTVTLTATPASGSKFTGWSGGCTGTGTCTLNMSAAKSVTATFAKRASITPILMLLLD